MRRLHVLALLTLASALAPPLARGQEERMATAGLEPTGTVLLASLHERADLVVHTSDLPALLASGTEAGLGTADAWQRSFTEQLARWGRRGDEKKLGRGGRDLLALADGEVLLAGMTLPGRRGDVRSFLFALRTRADADRIRAVLRDVVEGGLAPHYVGATRTERIQGRAVLALRGTSRNLWLLAADGLLIASDHPLAIGLLLEGIEKTVAGGAVGGSARRLLEVRYGRAAALWTAWTEDGAEWLRQPSGPPEPAPDDATLTASLAFPYGPEAAQPLLPARLPAWARAVSGFLARDSAARRATLVRGIHGSLSVVLDARLPTKDRRRILAAARLKDPRVRLQERGARLVLGLRPAPPGDPRPVTSSGRALHGNWLQAMAKGRWPLPLPGVSRTLIPPREKQATPSVAWTREKVFVRGPAWHGPATFLALRTLHDVCHGRDPGDVSDPSETPAEPDPGKRAPLPPPAAPRPAEER